MTSQTQNENIRVIQCLQLFYAGMDSIERFVNLSLIDEQKNSRKL